MQGLFTPVTHHMLSAFVFVLLQVSQLSTDTLGLHPVTSFFYCWDIILVVFPLNGSCSGHEGSKTEEWNSFLMFHSSKWQVQVLLFLSIQKVPKGRNVCLAVKELLPQTHSGIRLITMRGVKNGSVFKWGAKIKFLMSAYIITAMVRGACEY